MATSLSIGLERTEVALNVKSSDFGSWTAGFWRRARWSGRGCQNDRTADLLVKGDGHPSFQRPLHGTLVRLDAVAVQSLMKRQHGPQLSPFHVTFVGQEQPMCVAVVVGTKCGNINHLRQVTSGDVRVQAVEPEY